MADDTDDILRKRKFALIKEVSAAEEKLAPLYAERDKHSQAAEKHRAEMKRVNEKIRRMEEVELVPVRNNLARVAKALGAASLSDSGAE